MIRFFYPYFGVGEAFRRKIKIQMNLGLRNGVGGGEDVQRREKEPFSTP